MSCVFLLEKHTDLVVKRFIPEIFLYAPWLLLILVPFRWNKVLRSLRAILPRFCLFSNFPKGKQLSLRVENVGDEKRGPSGHVGSWEMSELRKTQ